MFSELGYDATTFHAVAVRAELTRPAINHYYASKSLLYEAVLDRAVRANIIPAIERARDKIGMIAQLTSFTKELEEINIGDRSVSAFLATAMLEANRHPELRPAVAEAQRGTREFLTAAVTGAISGGELATDAELSTLVDMLATVFWGMSFYAAFVDNGERFAAASTNLRQLLVNELWKFNA